MDAWQLLEHTHAILQTVRPPLDWATVTASLGQAPGVTQVVYVPESANDPEMVAASARPLSPAERAWIATVAATVRREPTVPSVWTEGPGGLVFPVQGSREPYGWIGVMTDDVAGLRGPETPRLGRLIGALLGLWADATRTNPEVLQRLQALYRTVLWGNDVMLRASDETELIRRTADRLLASPLFAGVAIDRGGRRLLTAGTMAPEPVAAGWSVLSAAIPRRGGRWGTLRVATDSATAGDANTQDLVRWSAELLGHGLEEWDLKRRLTVEKARHHYQATHDALTDLDNRPAFLAALPAAVGQAREQGTLVAVGILDLDNFKPVNDTYGHDAGDRLLRAWARRLAVVLDPHRVARLGGDEFAVCLTGFSDRAGLDAFLREALVRITAPLPVELSDGVIVETAIAASLGLTVVPEDDAPPEELLRHADAALYRAKEQKSERDCPWVWYQPSPGNGPPHHPHIPDGVRVHYQPIVDVHSGQVHSLEALVRLWDGHTLLAPGQFLADLSPADLQDLTFSVLDTVLRDMRTIDAEWATAAPLSIAVNLEPAMLLPRCIRHIGQQVARAAIAPERITLELLETSDFLSHAVARHQLQVLKEKRFQLALDDVGSAYSSLLRIKELPIDTLKLDQAFVRHIPEHPEDLLFVISTQTLARGFHAHFVAEGVETAEILDALQVLGVDRIQGYVLTPPLPLPALIAWGRTYHPEPSDGRPHSLLGAYAAHLAYQFVMRVLPTAPDPRLRAVICPLTHYLETQGGAHTALAREHAAYHDHWRPDVDDLPAAERLKALLRDALAPAMPSRILPKI